MADETVGLDDTSVVISLPFDDDYLDALLVSPEYATSFTSIICTEALR